MLAFIMGIWLPRQPRGRCAGKRDRGCPATVAAANGNRVVAALWFWRALPKWRGADASALPAPGHHSRRVVKAGGLHLRCDMLTKLKSLLPLGSSRARRRTARQHKKEGDAHLQGRTAAAAGRKATGARRLDLPLDYLDACVGLGFALSEQQQHDEAKRYLRHALSPRPGQRRRSASMARSTICEPPGRSRAGAIEHFARALELKPDFVFASPGPRRGAVSGAGQHAKAGAGGASPQRPLPLFPIWPSLRSLPISADTS